MKLQKIVDLKATLASLQGKSDIPLTTFIKAKNPIPVSTSSSDDGGYEDVLKAESKKVSENEKCMEEA